MQTVDTTTTTRVSAGAGARPDEPALGRYRLIRRLGAGAFGVVWLAHDEHLDRVVAVKRIEVHDAHVAARAEREALAAARLSHPAIVALHEARRDDDAVYLVSELVRGQTLGDLCAAGALSDRDVLRIGAALCDGLEHAHTRGVVHRDVKPANIIIPERPTGEAGLAKLTDFGVASIAGDDALTRTGDVVGTLAYMAPEQAEGREADGQADLYALGLVLYEALSGINPVRAPGAAATARRVGVRLPPLLRLRPDLPRALGAALDRAVQPHPEDRGTLVELRDALDAALETADTSVGPVSGPALELSDAGDFVPHGPRPLARPARRGEPTADDQDEAAPLAGRLAERLLAAAAAAGLCGGALSLLPPGAAPPPGGSLIGAASAAAAVLLLPRAGWLLAMSALAAWCIQAGLPGVAVLLAAAALPTVLLLPRDGLLWSAPVLAPVLGLAGLALAWPAGAGQLRRALPRAALGGLGLWWLALAEALARPRLLLGEVPGTPLPHVWESSAAHAVTDVLVPLLSHGVVLLALVWAAAAWMLPFLVRGRRVIVDAILACAWAAGLAAATASVAAGLPWAGGAPAVRGLVLGAVAAGCVALIGAAARSQPRF